MDKETIKEYLVSEAEYHWVEVDNMSNQELLDAYLRYQGIIGYTDLILDIIRGLYNVNLED